MRSNTSVSVRKARLVKATWFRLKAQGRFLRRQMRRFSKGCFHSRANGHCIQLEAIGERFPKPVIFSEIGTSPQRESDRYSSSDWSMSCPVMLSIPRAVPSCCVDESLLSGGARFDISWAAQLGTSSIRMKWTKKHFSSFHKILKYSSISVGDKVMFSRAVGFRSGDLPSTEIGVLVDIWEDYSLSSPVNKFARVEVTSPAEPTNGIILCEYVKVALECIYGALIPESVLCS
eukprot:CAMPEP_0196653342 /NCGR_PEP_ID=MMETSP1086-20130531/2964_1 /TAXON_ID=77921 /ORGANISM="Cyanoptyche  gloeocystis , Strain SAG4.97" /LENGTH=231 /DNA_ID=CAMNT_0041984489 /DNA_START=225 /DNA_END=920 /DNA_ORIENTATION=-